MNLPADVRALLDQLHAGAVAILGDKVFGLYLYGSLVTGGFDPDTSDIDFIVIIRSALTDAELGSLEALHRRLQVEAGPWAMKAEYGCAGISTRQHNEPAGNQEVWHYHLHVFPRYEDDRLYQSDRARMPPEVRATNAARLRNHLQPGAI